MFLSENGCDLMCYPHGGFTALPPANASRDPAKGSCFFVFRLRSSAGKSWLSVPMPFFNFRGIEAFPHDSIES
jgi:hypothetical protein